MLIYYWFSKMVEIKDLFGEISVDEYKAHLAIGGKGRDNDAPLRAFVRNEFKEGQEDQKLRNFEKKYIFSLIYYKKGEFELRKLASPPFYFFSSFQNIFFSLYILHFL